MSINEQDAIKACQQGKLEEFGKLFDLYYKKIYDFAYFRTHHKQTAEDIASSVFFKALQNIKSFNGQTGKFSSWLYAIARNAIIDLYRSNHSVEDIETVWDLSTTENIERDADTALALEKLSGMIAELSGKQKNIVLMRVWDGLSHKEISEILNISEESSKTEFSRALAKLREKAPQIISLILLIKLIINF